MFQSFFCESPQKPCLFLFASSQSKTSGFFTWEKLVHYFLPINQSLKSLKNKNKIQRNPKVSLGKKGRVGYGQCQEAPSTCYDEIAFLLPRWDFWPALSQRRRWSAGDQSWQLDEALVHLFYNHISFLHFCKYC